MVRKICPNITSTKSMIQNNKTNSRKQCSIDSNSVTNSCAANDGSFTDYFFFCGDEIKRLEDIVAWCARRGSIGGSI